MATMIMLQQQRRRVCCRLFSTDTISKIPRGMNIGVRHRKLLEKFPHIPLEWLPLHDGERWRKPRLSLRKIAKLRKEALKRGEEWNYPAPWGKPLRVPQELRPKEKIKRYQRAEERKADIARRLAEMPKRVEEYLAYKKKLRQEFRDKKRRAKGIIPP